MQGDDSTSSLRASRDDNDSIVEDSGPGIQDNDDDDDDDDDYEMEYAKVVPTFPKPFYQVGVSSDKHPNRTLPMCVFYMRFEILSQDRRTSSPTPPVRLLRH